MGLGWGYWRGWGGGLAGWVGWAGAGSCWLLGVGLRKGCGLGLGFSLFNIDLNHLISNYISVD